MFYISVHAVSVKGLHIFMHITFSLMFLWLCLLGPEKSLCTLRSGVAIIIGLSHAFLLLGLIKSVLIRVSRPTLSKYTRP